MQTQNKPNPQLDKNMVVLPHFPGYFLIVALISSSLFLYFLLKPFLIVLVLSLILATAFQSIYQKILVKVKDRRGLASFLTCLLILILLIIPLFVFVLLLGRQALDTYNFIVQQVQTGQFDMYLKWQEGSFFYDFSHFVQAQLGATLNLQSIDLKNDLISLAKNSSAFLFEQSADLLKSLGGIAVGFFLLFFSLYYFLKDSNLIAKKLMQISPLPAKYDFEIFRKFKEMSKASLYGIFLTSLAQGILGGIGFIVVGIPNALLWGTAMAFFSLIPLVGTSIIWLPASVFLMLTNHLVAGVILLLWGVLVIGTVDNFLRAYLIGNQVKMNPLLAFLSVFGGIGVFGLVGVIFGPLILTLFFTFLHIYELEYRSLLKK